MASVLNSKRKKLRYEYQNTDRGNCELDNRVEKILNLSVKIAHHFDENMI